MWIWLDDDETLEVEIEVTWEGPDVAYIDILSELPEGFTVRDVERAVLSDPELCPAPRSWMAL